MGDTVVSSVETAGAPQIEIRSLVDNSVVNVELRNRTEVIEDVSFVDGKSIVIRGRTAREYSRDETVTVIDWKSRKIVDTIWALAVYDLADPSANSGGTPWERGVVLHPEAHREAQQFVMLGDETSGGPPRRGFASRIAWSPDSKCLAIVEHESEKSHLVVIDISKGPRAAEVTEIPIQWEAFLEPRLGGVVPEAYQDAYVVIQALSFAEDGRSVSLKSSAVGPFAERTVKVDIPRTAG